MKHNKRVSRKPHRSPSLPKAPTGIQGLDELTGGGLPKGRPTLLCGSAGCGKTLLAMEFLLRGAVDYGEPGVFMAFEETTGELAAGMDDFLSKPFKRVELADILGRISAQLNESGEMLGFRTQNGKSMEAHHEKSG